ncbi:aldehyde dehydrogenase family protein [Anaerotruncus rubiinfantis]|uniref:aldehyde dehydrogenase family protein n=1 Tax=Anaerotruncus rubiinfantis TaxID=1720200 RepID=UPI0034A1158C
MEHQKLTEEQMNAQIAEMVAKGKAAMDAIEKLTQEDVRRIAKAVARLSYDRADVWSNALFAENGGSGRLESKIAQLVSRPLGLAAQVDGVKTVGVIEEDPDGYLVKIAKPLGVIASLVPMTVPTGLVACQTIFGLMAKNAMIFSPHPRTKKVTNFVVNDLRELLDRMGYPKDLLQCVENPSLRMTDILMKKADFVIATGGAAMVKAAYSSGTPAFGVGAGNSISYVDDSADLENTARGIRDAEMNDWGSGCSTENSVVIHAAVYDKMIDALKKEGGYLCNAEEKEKLINVLWKNGKLNVDCIIHTPQHIAKAAGFQVPDTCTFLMAEETHWGEAYPMTEEKLSPVIAIWKVKDLDSGIELVNNIHSISGAGHSCSIHSADEEHILRFASKTHTSRVAVNACTGLNNAGAYNNKMPWTFSLGCGSWGGNAYSENNTFKHYYNTTWVYRLMPQNIAPDRSEVFAGLDDRLFSDYSAFSLE